MSTPHSAMSSPAAPPATASRRLSARNWRISSRPFAPSARRIAVSRPRDAARASSRLAIFAQAISSTRLTAPSSTIADSPRFSLTSDRSGTTATAQPSSCGVSRAMRRSIAESSAAARSAVTAGFSRPITPKSWPIRLRARRSASLHGTRRSEGTGDQNVRGMTPMIVYGSSSTIRRRPRTFGSSPRVRSQKPYEMMMTRSRHASPAVKSRPRAGRMPSTRR
jgi:hypothetical protein